MATGRSMQVTKQAGEYLACAELCRRGFIATTFTGNVPAFDILAMNDKGVTKLIQVKTIRKDSWQFNALDYLKISISSRDIQTITGKQDLENPDLICILIKLNEQGKEEFYILRLKDLQDIVFEEYRAWLKTHGGKRPRKPLSLHTAVRPKDLSDCRNNWTLLEE